MIEPVRIGRHMVGPGQPCFIIAEAGVNHNGILSLALRLTEASADCGADAVKYQTFSTDQVIVPDAPKATYQRSTTSTAESQYEMLEKLALGREAFRRIRDHADHVGITFLSTPPDPSDVDFLVKLGVPALKVASMDIVNYPLLQHVGQQGLPVILSTGMADIGEIEKGITTLQQAGCRQLVLLHCITNYPIRDDEANLRVMETLSKTFCLPVGFSDHSPGIFVPVAAAALGACIIEKHFTLDKNLSGPDHAASLDPGEFKNMVHGIRTAQFALGHPVRKPLPVELENRKTMRRSLVASTDLEEGTLLTREHFAMKRPLAGLGAEFMEHMIGRRLKRSLPKNATFKLADIAWNDLGDA